MQNNTLDETLQKLKNIGIKEISKQTKLADAKIEDVLEKRFNKIGKVQAKGFINILEREYKVDLQEWLKAYNNKTDDKDVTSVSQVITKQESEKEQIQEQDTKKTSKTTTKTNENNAQKAHENKVLDIALTNAPTIDTNNESKIWIYAILGAIAVCVIGFFAYRAFMQENDFNVTTSKATTKQTQNIESAESNKEIKADNEYDGIFFDATNKEGISAQQNQQEMPEIPTFVPYAESKQEPLDSNVESTNNLTQTPSQTTPQATQAESSNSNAATIDSTKQNAPQAQEKNNVLYINAEQDLWLGVINLTTGQKEQFAYQKNYEIKLNGKFLFVMGHSNFNLTLNGNVLTHGQKQPVRMYYDGNNLVDVGYTQFKQLNGGAEW